LSGHALMHRSFPLPVSQFPAPVLILILGMWCDLELNGFCK
jgi:hypothetical protein